MTKLRILSIRQETFEFVETNKSLVSRYRRNPDGTWEMQAFGQWTPCKGDELEAAYQAYKQKSSND